VAIPNNTIAVPYYPIAKQNLQSGILPGCPALAAGAPCWPLLLPQQEFVEAHSHKEFRGPCRSFNIGHLTRAKTNSLEPIDGIQDCPRFQDAIFGSGGKLHSQVIRGKEKEVSAPLFKCLVCRNRTGVNMTIKFPTCW